MNELINKYSMKELSGRDSRLVREWQELDSLCAKRKAESTNPNRPSISYIIRRKNVLGIPTEYEIWYRCRSIVGVREGTIPRPPIFGYLHKMSIILPNNYPGADGNPEFKFITDIWHPNIRHSGNFQGKVCLTIKEMGVLASLKTLVLRVEQYLKYQMYHAQNTYPYPEDMNVAEWVREEGEPNGWIRFRQDGDEPTFENINDAVRPQEKKETGKTATTVEPKPKIQRI